MSIRETLASDKPLEGWSAEWLKWSVGLVSQRATEDECSELPYISNENIASWTGRLLNAPQPEEAVGARRFKAGDVLFNKLRPYLAKVHLAGFDGVSSGELLCLRPSERVSSRYLFYYLSSYRLIEQVNAVTFGAKMPRADWGIVGHQPFPMPERAQQERIADFLDERTAQIDDLIAKKESLLVLLAEKRQALITRAVTKGLNPNAPMKPSGIDWLGDIPRHWEVTRLDRLVDPKRPIRYGIVLPGPHYEGGVPIIKGGDVRPERLDPETLCRTDPAIDEVYRRSRLRPGDLVYSIRGSFGDVELVPDGLSGANLTQDAARIAPLDDIDRGWLLLYLKSVAMRQQMAAGAIGATIKGVNIRDLRRALVVLPSLLEQHSIAAQIGSMVQRVEQIECKVRASIDGLKEYRAALITAAVSGQLEVPGG